MREVSGPIIAIALVLCAVFVPLAFISGLTGQFYKQFALTIAISTVISAFNSLTLSPALAALLLKPHDAPKDWLTRVMDALFGWFFRAFNRLFGAASNGYSARRAARHLAQGARDGASTSCCSASPVRLFTRSARRLRAGAGQAVPGRLRAAARRRHARPHRGRDPPHERHRAEDSRASRAPSRSRACRSTASPTAPNAGIVFVDAEAVRGAQEPGAERRRDRRGSSTRSSRGIQDAFIAIFPPPPVQGLGTIGGFKLQIEDRGGLGYEALYGATQGVHRQGLRRRRSSPALFSSLPDQRAAALRRRRPRRRRSSWACRCTTSSTRCRSISARSTSTTSTSSAGPTRCSSRPTRTYRADAEEIGQLKTSNAAGEMVPLGALLRVSRRRAGRVPCATTASRRPTSTAAPAPGFSSGQAQAAIETLAEETLPRGIELRVDRADLPGDPGRQHRAARVPAVRAARVPGAGGAVRKPGAAAGDHHDRADGPAGGDGRRVAHAAATTTSSPRSA